MSETKLLFMYPKTGLHIGDIEVFEEIKYKRSYYSIFTEGCIYYKSIEDGIQYLSHLKDKYYEWLSTNYDVENLKLILNKTKNDCIFKSYNIQIFKDSYEEEDISIYLDAPSFDNIYGTYDWLEEIINKIKEFNNTNK